jgi:hypothetical protein
MELRAITENKDRKKFTILDYFLWAGFAYLIFTIPLYSFFSVNYLLAGMNTVDLFILSAAYLYYRLTFTVHRLFQSVLVVGILTMVVTVFDGGYEHTALFIPFGFSIFVLFVTKKKEAFILYSITFLLLALLFPLAMLGIIHLPYSLGYYGTFLYQYLASSVLLYLYLRLKDTLDEKLNQKTTDLTALNTKLEDEIREKEKLTEALIARGRELEEKSKELEGMNKLMIGRELKMTELKNEIDHLRGTA